MPGGDGTGPPGGGGAGRRPGRGGRSGSRTGSNRPGAGPGGDCVCPRCGARASHKIGVPCNSLNCPKCGSKMVRG
jgi:hypothetical protein